MTSRIVIRSGDNVIRSLRNAPKRVPLAVRVFDWCRLNWSWLADAIFLAIIAAITYGAWCLT